MAVITTLAACSTNPALNGPDGSDLPSTLDDALRYALSFIAQLRDGAGTAVGTVVQMPTLNAPLGYLKLNGQVVTRAGYPALWAFAQSSGCIAPEAVWYSGLWWGQFSTGDGSTNFRLPDLRGLFPRGLDEASGIDAGRPIGQFQEMTVLTHSHGVTDAGHSHGVNDPGHTHGANTDVAGVHNHAYDVAANIVATAGGAAAAAQVIGSGGTSNAGGHSHNIFIGPNGTGISIAASGTGVGVAAAGSPEGRPRNMAYPFYIKY